jgi:hypothetical protein
MDGPDVELKSLRALQLVTELKLFKVGGGARCFVPLQLPDRGIRAESGTGDLGGLAGVVGNGGDLQIRLPHRG